MGKKQELEVEVPEGVEVEILDNQIIVKNDSGQVSRKFSSFHVDMEKKDNLIILSSRISNRKVKSLVGTARGDLSNMIKGVTRGVSYKLKILYSHFPMNVKVQGQNVIIENFIGEKYPRKSRILDGVKVEINGQDITVSGIDKENVAQSAANLEQATKISKLDPRVFQDGIYIVEKDGKEIS